MIGFAALAWACGPTSPNRPGDDPGVDAGASSGADASNGASTNDGGSGVGCSKIDVLFVIDNSGSMGDEQQNLIANFPMMIQVLDQSGLDYRVAVTTTARDYSYSMVTPLGSLPDSTSGESGEMLQPSACNMTKRWIDQSDPDPGQTFSCLANVGTGGSSEEMPLGAIRDAFEDRLSDGTNAGFRRPDALLGVVILTDENDCSYEQSVNLSFGQTLCQSQMEPVANYKAFLDQYTGGPSRWAAAIIAGPGPGTCSSSFGNADEATRLKDFKNQIGANAILSSICEGDLSIGLSQALALFDSACDAIIL